MKKAIYMVLVMLCVFSVMFSATGCKTVTQRIVVESDTSEDDAEEEDYWGEDGEEEEEDADGSSKTSGQKTTSKSATASGGATANKPKTSVWEAGAGEEVPFAKRKNVTGEIILFCPWDTSADAKFKKINEAFKKEYPGTTLKIVQSDWPSRDIKLTQSIRSGTVPDYVPTICLDFPRRAIKNMMMPIDDLIQETAAMDYYIMDNVTAWNGKRYAEIMKGVPGIFYYNTTILKNAGIKDMPLKLSQDNKWTWADMKNMAAKLTVDSNKDGKPEVYGFGTEFDFMFPLAMNTDIVKMNGSAPTLNVDDPNLRSALMFFYDGINKEKIFSPVRWAMWSEFAKKNVAMYYGISGEAQKIIDAGLTTWEVAPFPKATGKESAYVGYSPNDGFGVGAGAKNPVGGLAYGEFTYNYNLQQKQSGAVKDPFTKAQRDAMNKVENRITLLYGYGMESSFCSSFCGDMRTNGDLTALIEKQRSDWQKNIDDTLKGR